jgi:hypothetical protein
MLTRSLMCSQSTIRTCFVSTNRQTCGRSVLQFLMLLHKLCHKTLFFIPATLELLRQIAHYILGFIAALVARFRQELVKLIKLLRVVMDVAVLRYEPLHPDPSLATPEVQIYTSSRHTGKCMLASAVHGRLTLLY